MSASRAARHAHEALEDVAVVLLVLGAADRNDPAARLAFGTLLGITLLLLGGSRTCRAATARPSRTWIVPRMMTVSAPPVASSATRSASAPTAIRPLPASRSRLRRIRRERRAGRARAAGRRASRSRRVSSSAPAAPTSMRLTRPSASKHGRQPPASELIVTRSGGAPLAEITLAAPSAALPGVLARPRPGTR